MAPAHGGAQRLMPGECPARAVGEEPEAVVEAEQHLLDGEEREPAGRQFERERNPVEPPAQLPHGVRTADAGRGTGETPCPGPPSRARGSARRGGRTGKGSRSRPVRDGSSGLRQGGCARLRRPFREQGHRVRLAQRRQREHRLARHPQGTAADREDGEPRSVLQKLPHEWRAALHEVLETVHDQQRPPLREVLDEHLARGLGGVVGQAEGLGQGVLDQVGVAQGRELGEPDPVAVAFLHSRGSPQREPGLADPAHAHDRDQAGHLEERRQCGLLGGASDEPVQLRREIAPSHGTRSVLIPTRSVQSDLRDRRPTGGNAVRRESPGAIGSGDDFSQGPTTAESGAE